MHISHVRAALFIFNSAMFLFSWSLPGSYFLIIFVRRQLLNCTAGMGIGINSELRDQGPRTGDPAHPRNLPSLQI